jgi:7-cyano-7-deazaguanine reductase
LGALYGTRDGRARVRRQRRNLRKSAGILARGVLRCQSRQPGHARKFGLNATLFVMSGATLETFPNPRPGREYEIAIRCPEFTSMCPKTGMPDFGEIRITYVPDQLCLELKALKLYMHEFRNRGIFYEAATNQILDDLVAACHPRRMTIVGDFTPRGGISTIVTASFAKG